MTHSEKKKTSQTSVCSQNFNFFAGTHFTTLFSLAITEQPINNKGVKNRETQVVQGLKKKFCM